MKCESSHQSALDNRDGTVDHFDIDHLRAQVMNALGRYDEALELLRELLAEESRIRGSNSIVVFSTRRVIAETLALLGQNDEALTTARALFSDIDGSFGMERVAKEKCRLVLAERLHATGNGREAKAVNDKALAWFRDNAFPEAEFRQRSEALDKTIRAAAN